LELKEPNFGFFSSKNFKLLVTQWATLAKFWCYFLKFLAYKTHIFKRLQAQALFFNTSIQFLFLEKENICLPFSLSLKVLVLLFHFLAPFFSLFTQSAFDFSRFFFIF
jgi:hypothetical protein